VNLLLLGLLVVSYAVSGLVLLACLYRLLPQTKCSPELSAAVALGFAPLLIATLLCVGLYAQPGETDLFYLLCVSGGLTVVAVVGLSQLEYSLRSMLDLGRKLFALAFRVNAVTPFVWLLYALLGALVLAAVFSPVYANDPLEYLQSARSLYEQKDMSVYPPMDGSISNGLFGPWSHPPGYVALLTWSYLVQGGAEYAGIAKVVSSYYLVISCICLMLLPLGRSELGGVVAAILLAITPFYFTSAILGSVDAVRIFPFTVAVLMLLFLDDWGWRAIVAGGVAVAAAFFTHSIAILLVPLLLVSGNVLNTSLKRTLSICAMIALGAVSVTPFVVQNVQNFGSVISDSPNLWLVDSLNYTEYFRVTRGIDGVYQRVMFGILQPFSRFYLYGLSYFLLLGFVVMWIWPRWRSITDEFLLNKSRILSVDLRIMPLIWLVVIVFFGGVVLSTALGIDTMIKNPRYILTVQPLVCILCGLYVGRLIGK